MSLPIGTLVRVGMLNDLKHLTHCVGNIHRELGDHVAFKPDGSQFTIHGYGVTMHDSHNTVIIGEQGVTPIEPPSSRGDLDLLVDWDSVGYKRRPSTFQPKGAQNDQNP